MTSTQTQNNCPIKLTEGAVREVKHLLYDTDVPEGYGLRIGVKGGGCSGLSYVLGFDAPKENDEVFEYEGFTVIMEAAHGMYLVGMEVDFHNGLNNRGFIFNNPNAKESCGCGDSFAV